MNLNKSCVHNNGGPFYRLRHSSKKLLLEDHRESEKKQ